VRSYNRYVDQPPAYRGDPQIMKTIDREGVVIAMYTVLATLATYPLILRVDSAIPLGGDSWQNYWNLWWVARALVEQHVSPYFAADLYFPYGATLYFHTLNLLPAVIALPVAVTFGIPAAFNFLVFLSFVLSGYGAYRLALYVLAHVNTEGEARLGAIRLAAFVAGIAFAFSSYRYVHLLGHLDLVSTQWLPFFVLFLLKTRDESGWQNAAIAAMLLAAAMLTAAYYMVFLLVFTVLVVADLVVRRGRHALRPVLRIGGIVLMFVIMVSPVLVPMLVLGRTEGRTINPSDDVDRFSADLLGFVVPSPSHPLWRYVVTPIYRLMMRPGSNIEIVAFAGFVPLMLGLIGVKRCAATRTSWLPLTIVFGVLALGPVVHLAGKVVMPQISFMMPYRLLSLMPYGDIPRAPARYVVMTMLCLSVIAGCGAWTVLKDRAPAVQRTITALLTVLAIGENAVVPVPLMTPDEPSFFRQIRDDPRRAGVLEVPIPDDPGVYPRRMLYQTIHTKPIYGGYLSRGLPPLAFSAVPGFGQFKTLSENIDDVVIYEQAKLRAISRAVLDFYSAGYVVMEKRFMDSQAVERGRHVADGLLGTSARVYEDDAMLAYAVPPNETAVPTAIWLDTGWSYLERLSERGPDGRPLRWHWMGERARFGIISSDSVHVRLKFIAQAFGRVRRVQLALNGSDIATIAITPDRADYETPVFEVVPDAKFLELTSLDGADSPGQDARRLSIAIFRLELVQDESKPADHSVLPR
jgi:hypothetical protein